jgi:hypothetical protein
MSSLLSRESPQGCERSGMMERDAPTASKRSNGDGEAVIRFAHGRGWISFQ